MTTSVQLQIVAQVEDQNWREDAQKNFRDLKKAHNNRF